ncbi:DUF3099 domain-containing protein [Kibdelosporangium persicum]|uniref:Transmembrane protein n=1 Tax=Kibdelosporangium persicum TaxID=2698649 RepID=A0ABX2FAN8_9PSEU|nr:DUF3099 domain-containing protein [Kibdelosporangium persicum]NRN68438.1 putative transmembrane protein [Kibdelosporangium persicum]
MNNPKEDDTPVLITEAAPSFDDQHAARKRKYLIMMSLRLPCLFLALIFIQTWWLALLFLVLSIPLPWAAVLIANDRPPRRSERVSRYRRRQGEPSAQLAERSNHHVIEG